jgi:hypothetical protein
MVIEVIVLGIAVYLIIGDLVEAWTEEATERARKMRLENDQWEYSSEEGNW